MRVKKFMFVLLFIFSLFVLLVPVYFGTCNEIEKIFNLLKYQEISRIADLQKDKEVDFYRFKENFLEKSNGVMGNFEFLDSDMNFLVFSDDCKRKNFCGYVFFPDCFLIKAKNNSFSENFFEYFDCLEEDDVVFFSCFGEKKKYSIKKIRFVSDLNEEIYCYNNPNSLNILVEMPYKGIYGQLLIKAVEISKEEEDHDFVSLFLNNRYLVIVFSFFTLLIFLCLFCFLRGLLCFLQKRSSNLKKKYVKNIYNFKYHID